jgi:hypothetical protein
MEQGKPIRRVWDRRFLAATVVVPLSMTERLNTHALAVLAVIRDEAKAAGRLLFQWHGLLSVPTSVEPKHGLPSGSQRALAQLPSRKRLAKIASVLTSAVEQT